ncbi:hypothetical protein A9Q81_02375 [Gammaproteobacteria bacterium 42_54_T18]|mgnify:CR=1 FL=1|nr:hypothetical protein A9Q81_02375 [Gammaproteobacteria bacterium 42_54_T18]
MHKECGSITEYCAVKNAGFTMIELIMVMVVLGILSVSASSLFSSKSNYVTFIAKDQLISMSLLAQQSALAQQQVVIVLCVSQTSDDWVFEVRESSCSTGDVFVESTAERESATLLQDALPFVSPQTFTYNNAASLSGGNNIQFLFVGDSDREVCLSSTGFAYSGVCQL